jgi:hypothetical protein
LQINSTKLLSTLECGIMDSDTMKELREYCDSVGVRIIKNSDGFVFVNSVDDGFIQGETLFHINKIYFEFVLVERIKERISRSLLSSVFNTP